jgi:rod shape determining protein RodA
MKPRFSLISSKFDWISALTLVLLSVYGLIVLYSYALTSEDGGALLNFKKQVLFVAVGLVLYSLVALYLDYRVLGKYSLYLYGIAVAMLLGVIFFGSEIRGTSGWFTLGPFSLQPVEFVKILAIIFLAHFFTTKAKYIHQLRYLMASAGGVIMLVALVLLQPDFGSAVIIFSLWFFLALITGMKKTHLLTMILSFAAAILIMWFFIFQTYQKDRIRVFLDPSIDPLGRGYNITQATIAIGSGGLFGRGLGFGSQSKLKFLPEASTDFIFAVIAEELGFAGIAILIGLFGVLFWRMLSTAMEVRDNFGLYLSLGVVVSIFIQFFINIGLNLGLLPVTGLPLPLISYGGSSMLATMIMLGLVQSVYLRK